MIVTSSARVSDVKPGKQLVTFFEGDKEILGARNNISVGSGGQLLTLLCI